MMQILGKILVVASLLAVWRIQLATAQDAAPTQGGDLADYAACSDSPSYDECATGKGECDCMCRRLWTLRGGAVALHRSTPSADVLLENPNLPSENLNGSDFDFDYRVGFDVSAIRHFDCWPDVEVRYLKVDGWNARANTVTNLADALRINTAVPIVLATGRSIDAFNTSQLDSFEVNLRRRAACANWLAGFRYLEFDEHFHADLVDAITPAPTASYDTSTQNRLYGIQAGLEVALCQRGPLQLDASIKGGVYGNSGRQNSLFNTGLVQSPASGSGDRTSFVGELSLDIEYCLTSNLSLQGAYGVLWIDDMFLATEQVNSTDFVAGTGSHGDGDVFYHGASLGLVYLR